MASRSAILNSGLYSWDYFQNDDVCRLCWSRDAHRVITVKSVENCISTKNLLAEKIEDCLSLNLSIEGAPKKVCSKCCDIVEKFYDYKRFCCEADRKLKEILNKHVAKTPKDVPEYSYDVEIEIMNDYNCSDAQKSHSIAENSFKEYPNISPLIKDQIEKQANCIPNMKCFNSNKISSDSHKTDSLLKFLKRASQIQKKRKKTNFISIRKHAYLDTEPSDTKAEDSLKNPSDSKMEDSLQDIKHMTLPKDDQTHKVIRREVIHNSNIAYNNLDTESSVSMIKDSLEESFKVAPLAESYPIPNKVKDSHNSPIFCYICRAEFKTKEKFNKHNSEQHGILLNGQFKCFGCDKRFKNRKNRLGHEINFCKGLKDGYKCGVCGRFLPKRRTYEIHMRAHKSNKPVSLPEEIFKCGKCYELFKTRENLSDHKKVHEVKEEFVCEACGRRFTRRDYLSKHRLTHENLRQHACPHCDYKAVQRASLLVHLRKHTGERPFGCDLCPQRCVSSGNLRAHRLRHLGVKRFQCSICSKKFGYKETLQEHTRITHERDVPTYACQECGAIYSRRRGLRRHVEAKHGKPKEKPPTKTDGVSGNELVLVAIDECEEGDFVV